MLDAHWPFSDGSKCLQCVTKSFFRSAGYSLSAGCGHLAPSGESRYTQKIFGTRRSIFVCCTEDIYKFVSRTDPFESSPCGTRSDSSVTGKYLFVTHRLRHFERGGVVQTLRYGIF